MRFHATVSASALAALLLFVAPQPAAAQVALDSRVAAAPADATVSFRFEAHEELCGDGERFIGRDRGDGRSVYYERSGREPVECLPGPARVTLARENGRVTRVRAFVGGSGEARAGEIELGEVPARDAAAWLLAVAQGTARVSADERAAADAVFASTLAAGVEVWPDLLAIARDERAQRRARTAATFWLGQAAGDRITAELGALATLDGADIEIRKHAIFALSQRRDGEGIPPLLDIARTHDHAEIRRQALFWLSQSGDPRALALFEELLIGRR